MHDQGRGPTPHCHAQARPALHGSGSALADSWIAGSSPVLSGLGDDNWTFTGDAQPHIVMRGLDPRIHGSGRASADGWIAGSSPAMTVFGDATSQVLQRPIFTAPKPDSTGSSPAMTILVERDRQRPIITAGKPGSRGFQTSTVPRAVVEDRGDEKTDRWSSIVSRAGRAGASAGAGGPAQRGAARLLPREKARRNAVGPVERASGCVDPCRTPRPRAPTVSHVLNPDLS